MILSVVKIVLILIVSGIVGFIELARSFVYRGDAFTPWFARVHGRTIFAICGVRLVARGAEQLDPARNYIYVSNHASMFDIPSVYLAIHDRIRIMYKKELNRIPIWGWAMAVGNYFIPVDRGRGPEAMRSLEAAINKIRNGASVLLFAEGTRTGDGRLQAFKRGAFHIAARAGVPIVPVTINGSYRIFPKGSWRITPGTITVVISKPIAPPAAADGRDAELRLRDEVYAAIAEHYIDQ